MIEILIEELTRFEGLNNGFDIIGEDQIMSDVNKTDEKIKNKQNK